MKENLHPIEKHFSRVTRYHYFLFGFIWMSKIPLYWQVMSMIFLNPPMKFQCMNPTSAEDQCPCDVPSWNRTVFTETIQTKYNIVCDREWIVRFSESMLYLGSLAGSLFFGFLSDKFGRLLSYSTCCFGIGLTGCLVTVMPTVASYIFMRFLTGIFAGGGIITGFVLIMEYCGTNYRDTVAAMYHIPLNIGHITLSGVSYLLKDCDHYQLALSLPMFIFALSGVLLYESPKWLTDSGHIVKSVHVMKKIAKFNKYSSHETIQAELEDYHTAKISMRSAKIHFWQIFQHKKLSRNLFCMSFIYLVCGMGFYGVSLYIGNMSGDIHQNVSISGVLLLPGTITSIFLLKLLSRKIFLMATSALSGIFMLLVVLISPDWKYTRIIIASLGNASFFMSFIIVFLYGVELFPTVVRSSVLGFLSMLARLGQIIAPPINALNPTVAGTIFGVSAILGAVLCYPLPETKNVAQPSTVEESTALHSK